MNKLMIMLAMATASLSLMSDAWTDPKTGYTWTYRINGDTVEIYNKYFDVEPGFECHRETPWNAGCYAAATMR